MTKKDIIKRYADTLLHLAKCIILNRQGLIDDLQSELKDAGEAMSQTIEWAVKRHICDNIGLPTESLKEGFPKLIDGYYLNSHSKNCVITFKLTNKLVPVDFEYLKSNKYDITNKSKHNGEDLCLEDLLDYEPKVRSFLMTYITKETLPKLDDFLEPKYNESTRLYKACDNFEIRDHTYILVIDRQNVNSNILKILSRINWSVIIDFDRSSLKDGFIKASYESQDNVSGILKVGDKLSPNIITKFSERPFVYFANGYKDQPQAENYISWTKKKYSKSLGVFFELVAEEFATDKTIVVSLLNNVQTDTIKFVRDKCLESFVNVHFILSGNDNIRKKSLEDPENNVFYIPLNVQELADCINFYLPQTKEISATDKIYRLPYLKQAGTNTDGIISKGDFNTLQGFMEVLYLGCENDDDTDSYNFFCGKSPLSWHIEKMQEVPRISRFKKNYLKPLEDFIRKGRGVLFLSHDPGYGGTTVARQLAWDIHEDNPVVFIKKNTDRLNDLLTLIHQITRKTIVAFVEVPQVMSVEEAFSLFYSINSTRPIVFVLVCRNNYNVNDYNSLSVTSWGNDVSILVSRFKPYLEKLYSGEELQKKKLALSNLIYSTNDYEKTPFYVGLLTFEREFYAVDNYIEKFAKILRDNEPQKRTILYLSICDYYAHERLKASFFRTVFGIENNGRTFRLENFFSDRESVVSSLLTSEEDGKEVYWKIRYSLFSEKLLACLLGEGKMYKANLSRLCKKFIEDCSNSETPELYEDVLKQLFIGSSAVRAGENFTKIVMDLEDSSKLNLFKTLHECYPQNPHFCSHLARFYANVEHDMAKAIEYADRAIRLSEFDDPLLHHIKGMCYRSIIYQELDNMKDEKRRGKEIQEKDLSSIALDLIPKAESEFERSRLIEKESESHSLHGYVADIQMLIKALDCIATITGISKSKIIYTQKEPYVSWIEHTQNLLEEANRIHSYEDDSDANGRNRVLECDTEFRSFYQDYSSILNNLNNMLENSKHPSPVRRMLARTYMMRNDNYKNDSKLNRRILELMEQNISEDPHNEHNYTIWYNCARYSSLNLDEILEKVDIWRSLNPFVDTIYYSYVINVVKALDGSSEAAVRANNYIDECKRRSAGRIFIKDWYVGGDTMRAVISNTKEVRDNKNKYLKRVRGTVSEYMHEGRAKITIEDTNLEVFFSPTMAKLSYSCLNKSVYFFFGFSFDGLRADSESIQLIDD